jgi:DNA repair protein RecN (Recombination protein N)
MIRHLAISNLAVIESVSVEFERSFNVLTGETGAGKSMLVGAVGLLLGGRASQDLVRTGEDVATVEATFERPDGRELVVRREVTAQGRSRAFVDGQPTTAAALRPIVAEHVELHGQHEHQLLLDPMTHVPWLDAWAGLEMQAAAVQRAWESLATAERALEQASMAAGERAARLELVEFHLAELRKAMPVAGEDETLAQTRDVLRHAGRLTALSAEAYAQLYDDEGSALSTLAQVWKRIQELASIDPTFAPYAAARDGIKAQLEDLALTLRDYHQHLDASPGRLQEVEDRLALLERLKRKHGPTLDDVLARMAALEHDRAALDAGPGHRDAAEAAAAAARAAFLRAAGDLSAARRRAAPRFAAAIEAELAELAMAGTSFELRLQTDEAPAAWHAGGIDRGEFFLAPNLGEAPRPLARIASGGELSRVMLAFKTLGAGAQPKRTLVFDEVDAGIGGRAASVVGEKLRRLGETSQVLCITHLPPIAAQASTHFAIVKTVRGPRTITSVARLDQDSREREIARMMGGAGAEAPQLLAGARELLAQAEAKAKVRAPAKAKGESRGAKARAR